MPELHRLYEADRSRSAPTDHRVRLGVFGFVERERDNAAATPPGPADTPPRKTAVRRPRTDQDTP
jgi:hypothetical protein